jgi:tetratricopeptide (TPR) repeat protein
MFYLLSALAMPISEAYRRIRGRASGGWRMVAGQLLIVGGILVGMFLAGRLLGVALHASQHQVRLPLGSIPSNALRIAALVLSIGTLGAVLGAVELLRLWIHRAGSNSPRERDAPVIIERRAAAGGERRRVARTLIALVLFEAAAASHPRNAQPQHPSPPPPPVRSPVAVALARADSAFTAGSTSVASRNYAAVLAVDPENTHAIYRLAQLSANRAEALQLFKRYVELEPEDPWGYMAVGEVLAHWTPGQYRDALRWYDQALRLAPDERDAVVGRARVLARARRTDAAIAAYDQWLEAHETDVEAWRELAREQTRAGRPADAARSYARAQALAPDQTTARRLALARAVGAPALGPQVSGSHDSDGNATLRVGGAAEFAVSAPLRLGVTAGRERVTDGVTTTGLTDVGLRAFWRPRAVLQVEASGGVTALDAIGGESATTTPTGQLRARWRPLPAGPALDLRLQRNVLDASPQLVTNRVTRSEFRGTLELPLARVLKLRGIARAAALSDPVETNHRMALGGVVALIAAPSVELSARFNQIRYDRPDTVGYFAPRLAQVVQAGSYLEFETPRGALFSFDVGAGVQRVAKFSAGLGPWQRALSLYSSIVLPLAPGGGRDLKIDLGLEDYAAGNEAATSAGSWRYISVATSLQWALR